MSRPVPPQGGTPESALGLMSKLSHPEALTERLIGLPRPWVFTNGVFDLLHRGHVIYLEAARALGASLIVGINTDRSVRGLGKGPERPINTEQDRAIVLAALASVSLVTWFDEPTPLALLERVRPDLYVKGGDYRLEDLPEVPLVRGWGGEARVLPFVTGYSTTGLVRLMKEAPAG
jgi:rfaE bifunctional protein nucleotidyltransferase chain/domain